MAETKAATTRKAPAKKRTTTVENIVQEVEQVAEKDYAEVKTLVTEESAKLEGLTVQQLRQLHDEAIVAESEAKRLVHVLRQRASNLEVSVDTRAEEEIIAAKKELAKAINWIKTVEKKLENEFRDIWGERF